MSGNYHDAPHLRALIRNMFGDDQNPNEAGMNIRQQPQQQLQHLHLMEHSVPL